MKDLIKRVFGIEDAKVYEEANKEPLDTFFDDFLKYQLPTWVDREIISLFGKRYDEKVLNHEGYKGYLNGENYKNENDDLYQGENPIELYTIEDYKSVFTECFLIKGIEWSEYFYCSRPYPIVPFYIKGKKFFYSFYGISLKRNSFKVLSHKWGTEIKFSAYQEKFEKVFEILYNWHSFDRGVKRSKALGTWLDS